MRLSDGANLGRAFKATSEKIATNLEEEKQDQTRKERSGRYQPKFLCSAEAVLGKYVKHLIDF